MSTSRNPTGIRTYTNQNYQLILFMCTPFPFSYTLTNHLSLSICVYAYPAIIVLSLTTTLHIFRCTLETGDVSGRGRLGMTTFNPLDITDSTGTTISIDNVILRSQMKGQVSRGAGRSHSCDDNGQSFAYNRLYI